MGEIRNTEDAILTVGLLLPPDEEYGARALTAVERGLGKVCDVSKAYEFGFTRYYEKEMGPGLVRQFWAIEGVFSQGDIAKAKLEANALEAGLSAPDGRRRVNIDPGYVTQAKLVVPSTKDATYRIYISDGIYAQPMLFFKDGSFRPWEWTYADYRDPEAVEFFNRVRLKLKSK